MDDGQLRELTEQIAALEEAGLILSSGQADGFGMVGASVLDVTREGTNVRVWNEGNGDFWFEFGDQQQAAWWRQDGKGAPPTKVVMALLAGRYEVRKGRVTVSVDEKLVVLRESI